MSAPVPAVGLEACRAEAHRLRAGGRTLALVPTLGALHAGHAALVARAHEVADAVAVSIFVNPLQFGPAEDLERYPRTLDADLARCESAGVDLVFAPTVEGMYPGGEPLVRVAAGPMAERFEGAARPGHFDGVLTVVLKLFDVVGPDVALFGQKDAQQLTLVRQMVHDLNVPVRIEPVATVRDPDGLALSSRNAYLDPSARASALAIPRALAAAVAAAAGGAAAVVAATRAVLDAEPGLALGYCALVDPADLSDVGPSFRGRGLLLVAARVGGTRLIDNALIDDVGVTR
jgi:pantoate--beta-alanine ligase